MTQRTSRSDARPAVAPRSLEALVAGLDGVVVPPDRSVPITGIRTNSAEVEPGDLFVAVRGTAVDGHEFVAEAVRRGAAALVVESLPAGRMEVPIVQVEASRRALAELAAAWNRHPARGVPLVGISGTVGKTSVLAILEAILGRAGIRAGAIGSLGVQLGSRTLTETGFTAPDALVLHESLAELRARGSELIAMEVTSHALAQERVHGLRYQLGVFTNLLPLEHQEYHGSFESYVEAKVRFFDLLDSKAPLVYNSDDAAVRALVTERRLEAISCGFSGHPDVRIEDLQMSAVGTRLRLRMTREVRTIFGGAVPPLDLTLEIRLLGRSNVRNAALAAIAALLLGAGPGNIRAALADFPPPRRRAEILHHGRFTIIDDTVGHPESVNALFEAVIALRPRRVHMTFAVRGNRGAEINHHIAEAIGIWAAHVSPATVVVTRSEGSTDERNRVSRDEEEAFLDALRAAGVLYRFVPELGPAVRAALEAAEDGDLVLLLGAQGMDGGAAVARDWLAENVPEVRSAGSPSRNYGRNSE